VVGVTCVVDESTSRRGPVLLKNPQTSLDRERHSPGM
jgi:hypothetical protein